MTYDNLIEIQKSSSIILRVKFIGRVKGTILEQVLSFLLKIYIVGT